MIDLHMHSVYSDGTCSPGELIDQAVIQGVTAVALTDHDTVAGVPEFLEAASSAGIRAVSGVELSAFYGGGDLHLLGYAMDMECELLHEGLARMQASRAKRNDDILNRLRSMNVELDLSDLGYDSGQIIGRPHFAQALLAKGYVRSIKEAFDRYLACGSAAYVPRKTIAPQDAIQLIRSANGIPVLAHPFTLQLDDRALYPLLGELKDAGLLGLEVYYSRHTPAQTERYLDLCRSLGLVPSGGSDYHGMRTPDITIGRGFGRLHVPDEVYEAILNLRS